MARDRFTSRSQAAARFVAQRGLLKAVVWTITRVTVIGREQLKGVDSSYVVVANHSSHLDAPLIQGAIPRRLGRYLAAGAAADYFFDVWWRRRLTALFFNAFPVDRTGAAKRSVSAKELLRRGVPLLVFPEGTRTRSGRIAAFKPGAAALAASAEVPVLPVAIIGAYEAHPRGSKWPKPGRLPIGVVFGAPMRPLPGETPVDFTTRIRDAILAMHAEHASRILGRPAAPHDPDTTRGDPA
ncbi:lysophospholipid acyltransferase family protein [Homoserinibacter sp. YIM 151385]|uniref:lysophospholipid acyltransferase family protein n=1 Tax=Homoserinibacter sp. YIM 151385 TaxID=2985506 RepID=UPI0022F03D25|nr:lysophospholipid acyltransferase family protein [Homoserinibacter sp. YIM 151385]WBU37048.1 lysophospholipid acyltransferase family protein [Homoserinibacter sp. YIM 151385]